VLQCRAKSQFGRWNAEPRHRYHRRSDASHAFAHLLGETSQSRRNETTFVWWNTSLSPADPNKSTTLAQSIAFDLLDLICHDIRPDAICLGEISSEDIARLEDIWVARGYGLIDGIRPVGRTSFDTCVLFRTDTLVALHNKDLVAQKASAISRSHRDLILAYATTKRSFISLSPTGPAGFILPKIIPIGIFGYSFARRGERNQI
jgi:hypothetical protein